MSRFPGRRAWPLRRSPDLRLIGGLIAGLVLILVAAGAVLVWLTRAGPAQSGGAPPPAPFVALETLIEPDAGVGAQTAPAPLLLPRDHGAHPQAPGELWGLWARLEDPDGRALAFQLSLTRLRLRSHGERDSAWATPELYRGQAVLIGERAGVLRSAERLSRGALGLAGAATDPARVWIEDWALSATTPSAEGGLEGGALVLRTEGRDWRLTLDLRPLGPPIAVDQLGLFDGDGDMSALRGYLLPRLEVVGELVLDADEPLRLTGSAWLDHVWGRLPTGRGQLRLDRVAVQLDDGRDLLCLRLRRGDGSGTPIPGCALMLADGRVQSFRRRELELEPSDWWRSRRTGERYPVAWRLLIRPLGLELSLTPWERDQELDGALRLWSGAMDVAGRQGEARLRGTGRVELTGGAG